MSGEFSDGDLRDMGREGPALTEGHGVVLLTTAPPAAHVAGGNGQTRGSKPNR